MCGIMVYSGNKIDRTAFDKAFAATKSRGPDDTRVVDTGCGLMGFHRLAIMGLHDKGMQPFALDGNYVVCNGELYGFAQQKRALTAKGYAFVSDSDCEILLPLWKEYGVDMFAMLDAEYALVLYDAQTHSFVAARDPIGIRPLYYGYDKDGNIVLASEAKNLVGLVDTILPFPVGHYYKDGQFVCYRDIAK